MSKSSKASETLKETTKQHVLVHLKDTHAEFDEDFIIIPTPWLITPSEAYLPISFDEYEDLYDFSIETKAVKVRRMTKAAVEIKCYTSKHLYWKRVLCC